MGRLLCLLLLPLLTYGFALEWMRLFDHFKYTAAWRYFAIGGLMFTAACYVYKERMTFFFTLEHELTHTIAGMLCFKTPTNLSVASHGGEVMLSGSNWFIQLAPYFLPVFQYAVLGVTAIAATSYRNWGMTALGATMAFYVVSTVKEV